MVFTKNKEKMVVNKNIDINIDSYPISMAISIVPNIIDIDILVTPAVCVSVQFFLNIFLAGISNFGGNFKFRNPKYSEFSAGNLNAKCN